MARSVWKGPFVELHLLKKAEEAQDKNARAPIMQIVDPEYTVLVKIEKKRLPNRHSD